MKKILIGNTDKNTIHLDAVTMHTPVFGVKHNKIIGMFLKENQEGTDKWVFRHPDGTGCDGHHDTRLSAIKGIMSFGIDIVTE